MNILWQVGESDMTVVSGHTSSSGLLLEVGGVLPGLHGGEMQSASTTVPASPAASGRPILLLLCFSLFCISIVELEGASEEIHCYSV